MFLPTSANYILSFFIFCSIKTERGEFCYDQNFQWALDVYTQFHSTANIHNKEWMCIKCGNGIPNKGLIKCIRYHCFLYNVHVVTNCAHNFSLVNDQTTGIMEVKLSFFLTNDQLQFSSVSEVEQLCLGGLVVVTWMPFNTTSPQNCWRANKHDITFVSIQLQEIIVHFY